MESRSLAHTRITPKIRVSTAALPREDYWGNWMLIETWIFSDDPRQRSTQIIHKSEPQALRAHAVVVRGLRNKFKEEALPE